MSQHNRQRHHLRGFGTGIANHHALISGSQLLDGAIFPEISSLFQRTVHSGGNIRTLLVDETLNGKPGWFVAYLSENRMSDLRDVRLKQARDLSGHDDLPLGGQHFAGHTGESIVGKTFVQYAVGDQIAQLVRMPFRNGFCGIKLIHGILLYRS